LWEGVAYVVKIIADDTAKIHDGDTGAEET
jgi:hypothetical protein